MLKMKPTFIEENGKAKFVVFSMKDYATIKEALEDAEDSRILNESKRRGAGKPLIPHHEILQEFRLPNLMRNGKRRNTDKSHAPFGEGKRSSSLGRKGPATEAIIKMVSATCGAATTTGDTDPERQPFLQEQTDTLYA